MFLVAPLGSQLCECAISGLGDAARPETLPRDADAPHGYLGLDRFTHLRGEYPGGTNWHLSTRGQAVLGFCDVSMKQAVPLSCVECRQARFDRSRPAVWS
eukprot:567418-Amphidinium_carterae.2